MQVPDRAAEDLPPVLAAGDLLAGGAAGPGEQRGLQPGRAPAPRRLQGQQGGGRQAGPQQQHPGVDM